MLADDVQAIRELIATWLRATAEGDLSVVLSLMADDVIFLTPGQPPMRGKAAFASGFQSMRGTHRIEAASEVREVEVVGNWAFCWTDLKVTISPVGDGPPVRRTGNTLSVLRKQPDGRWVIARDANMLTVDRSSAG